MDAGKRKYDKPPNPRATCNILSALTFRATCNILSALTFSWTLGLFREGRKRDLEVTDLYEPLREHTSSYLGNKLERIWNEELITAKKRGREPSFLRSLAKCFGPKMILYGLVLAFMECVLSEIGLNSRELCVHELYVLHKNAWHTNAVDSKTDESFWNQQRIRCLELSRTQRVV
ncbi:hypothetical protein M8J77_020997 [Diaphorina citri]|nr:hypothetical protein M8J77_020997 [Diaphorina citri]